MIVGYNINDRMGINLMFIINNNNNNDIHR